jgi:hypothetical protein
VLLFVCLRCVHTVLFVFQLRRQPPCLVLLLSRVLVLNEKHSSITLIMVIRAFTFIHHGFDNFKVVNLLVHARAIEKLVPVDDTSV